MLAVYVWAKRFTTASHCHGPIYHLLSSIYGEHLVTMSLVWEGDSVFFLQNFTRRIENNCIYRSRRGSRESEIELQTLNALETRYLSHSRHWSFAERREQKKKKARCVRKTTNALNNKNPFRHRPERARVTLRALLCRYYTTPFVAALATTMPRSSCWQQVRGIFRAPCWAIIYFIIIYKVTAICIYKVTVHTQYIL